MNDEDWSRVKELRLLDDIEDARERLTRMRRALTVGIMLAVGGVALVIGTATAQTLLPLPAAWGFIYILYTAMIVGGGGITVTAWLDELPPARKALKRAERAHRNWTMGAPGDWS